MKLFTLTTIPLLCAAISPLCAEGMMRHSRNQPANACQEQQFTGYTITPQAGARAHSHVNPFFTADFILWKAHQDGLDFAYSGAPVTGRSVDVTKGQVFQPGHKYEPGFKLGFGMKFLPDAWDVYANYTWLQASNSVNVSDTMIRSNYGTPDLIGVNFLAASGASANWKLNFNVLDLELGRDFYISKKLTLRPHFGFKFSWMKQKFDVDLNDLIYGASILMPQGADVDLDFRQRQFGVGLRTGIDTAWILCKHLSLFGDLALTGLWSHFNENRKDTVTPKGDTGYDTFNVQDKISAMTVVLEFAFGLRYDYSFNCNKNLFFFQAGWEQQFWLNQNQFFRPSTTNADDLSFQGLTAKMGFAF